MTSETPDITRAQTGIDGVSWNILGQVYVPKQASDDSFSWHATFPVETFVPPHVHPYQDEYIFVLDGRIDLLLAGKKTSAGAGDLVRGLDRKLIALSEPHEIAVGRNRWVSTRKR